MATPNQIQANRLNAQNSTGPASVEGKARSRFNALQTGIHAESEILPWEDPAERAALAAEYYRHHLPQTPGERALVDSLVHCEFLNRRYRKMEVKIILSKLSPGADLHDDRVIGSAWCYASADLARLQRRMDAAHRAFHRDLDQLRLLESQRPDFEADPEPPAPPEPPFPTAQPTVTKEETPKLASFPQTPTKTTNPQPPDPSPQPPLPRPSTFNPKNPTHPPIEVCPHCSRRGSILDNCHYRPRNP